MKKMANLHQLSPSNKTATLTKKKVCLKLLDENDITRYIGSTKTYVVRNDLEGT